MIYPNTKATVAQVVTRQVTAPEAAVLHFVYRHRAVHACELNGYEEITFRLLNAGLLHCRTTRIGQVICMTPQGNVQINQSEMRVIAPSASMNVVYHRAALRLARERGYGLYQFLTPILSHITDGSTIHWMIINATMHGPSGATVLRAVLDMQKQSRNGYVVIVADDVNRYSYHLKMQPRARAWELQTKNLSQYLQPL